MYIYIHSYIALVWLIFYTVILYNYLFIEYWLYAGHHLYNTRGEKQAYSHWLIIQLFHNSLIHLHSCMCPQSCVSLFSSSLTIDFLHSQIEQLVCISSRNKWLMAFYFFIVTTYWVTELFKLNLHINYSNNQSIWLF